MVLAEDPEYLAKRAKNNEAIKKSREKARIKVGPGGIVGVEETTIITSHI